eukprot:sb/3478200/
MKLKFEFHGFFTFPLLEVGVPPRKTLKSGCLPLLTIHRFWHSRRVRAIVRVWLGFGFWVRLGLSILYQRCRLVYSNRLVLSIFYQMPFSLLKSECGYVAIAV